MHPSSLSRLSGWSFIALTCAAALPARAQTADLVALPESVELDRFVVSASRTPQDPAITPSSVSIIDLEALADLQIVDLRTALAQEPGVVVVQTGTPGGPTSVFMRGANGDHTLFVVDGIRMSDRSATYLSFLGGADLANLGRVEVLRGPQSTLYGSSAMGGVILLESARGAGPFSGVATATVGSFDTWGGSVAIAGSTGALGYSASVGRRETANDAPKNAFEQWTYGTRLEYAAAENLAVGFTFRGQNDSYEQTGSRLFYAPGQVENENYLGTVYAEMRVAENITSRLTAGLHRRNYTFTDQWGTSDLRNRREVVDWQNTWQAAPSVELVAGANYERSRYLVDASRSRDEAASGYLSGTWHAADTVTVTGGLRYDHFDSAGDATTGRAGVSWRPVSGTKLRATYGTGFAAPGSDDRFGVPQWGQLANPNLRPEESRGWDVGIDQSLGNRVTLGLTYFRNDFDDLFQWEYVDFVTFQGRTANVASAETHGVELGVRAELTETVQARASYTYLEATNSDTGARLLRRPRHVIDAEVTAQLTTPWMLGAGVHAVADRVERASPIEDYTTVRVFSAYALREDLILKVRVENALDEEYEEVLGYASLPRGIFASVEWRF